jgi:hypothetical protein
MNGDSKTLAFPSPEIPIIGQPFTVKSGFATTLIQCGCERAEPIILLASTPASCRACGRTFVCVGFAFDGQTGQIQARVGLMNQPAPTGDIS